MNKIFKNSLYNVIRVVILIPIFFLLIPYTIHKIGSEAYGLWALTGVIASYQAFVDMGFTTAIIRYVAKEEAANNYLAISEYIVVALFIYLILPMFLGLPIIFFREFIASHILGIKNDIPLACLIITISVISSYINLISGLFKSIIDGMQRMDISNILLTIQIILSSLGTIFFLEYGYGLKGLALNLLLSSLISLLLNIYYSKKALPNYKIRLSLFKYSRFRELLSYSINLQLSSLSRFWIEPLNKILISHYYSINYVGYYDIALKFIGQLNNIINSALVPIFPASAEIHQIYGIERVENLRIKSIKYILPSSILIYSFVLGILPGFIKLWLGNDLIIVSTIIQIFLISSFFITLGIPAYVILNGLGYAKDTLKVQIQSAIINICGVTICNYLFGFYGFCTAFSISILYSFFATHYYYKKRLGIDNNKKLYEPFIKKYEIILGIIFVSIETILISNFKLDSYLKIVSWSILYLGLFLFVIIKCRIIKISDMETLFGKNITEKYLLFRSHR